MHVSTSRLGAQSSVTQSPVVALTTEWQTWLWQREITSGRYQLRGAAQPCPWPVIAVSVQQRIDNRGPAADRARHQARDPGSATLLGRAGRRRRSRHLAA